MERWSADGAKITPLYALPPKTEGWASHLVEEGSTQSDEYTELALALTAAESRASSAEAQLAEMREALRLAEVALVEAAIPLEAIVATGKGSNSLAVWDGACNAVAHIRRYMDGKSARRVLSKGVRE